MTSIDAPTPVVTVTTRAAVGDVSTIISESIAALRETASRLQLNVVSGPLRVDHGAADVVEVCLAVDRLPDDEPPPPVAAEVLVPGTQVEVLDVD